MNDQKSLFNNLNTFILEKEKEKWTFMCFIHIYQSMFL